MEGNIRNLLVKYYKTNNIDDYPKTTKGEPDMRASANKKMAAGLMRHHILQQNQKENKVTTEPEGNYRKEIEDLTEEQIKTIRDIHTQVCSICYDSLSTSYAKLPCDHLFCPSCLVQHGRQNNNCPMCRQEFTKAPQTNKPFRYIHPDHENNIHQNAMLVPQFSYQGEAVDFHAYLGIQFTHYADDKEMFLQETMKGIKRLLETSSYQLTRYYETVHSE